MGSLQGTKFSPNNIVLYESLGSLLRDYRKWRKLTQECFAEAIRVSVRELRNWEADRRRAGIENLHDISEVTGIPMQVCVALNADQPIWYSLRKRLFMYSSIEEAQFYSRDLLKYSGKPEDGTLLKKVAIIKDRQIDMLLSCHQDLYGPERPLRRDVIKAAILILPDLNYIMLDCWNHYVAHEVCLPIKMDVYRELKKQKTIENYLTSKMISDIIALGEGVFFYYSSFAANISASSWLIMDGLRAHSKIKQKERYLCASHTVIKESAIIQKNLGMKLVKDYKQLHNELRPAIYEMGLYSPPRLNVPDRWEIKQIAGEDPAKNMMRRAKQVWSPAISYNKPNNLVSPFKKHSSGEMAQPDTITDDTISDTITDDRPYLCSSELKTKLSGSKIEIETCPNTKCPLYGKSDKANIVYNGTYRPKNGTTLRRFICKECGKAFCSRTSSIFYCLRSPDEKIIEALKLLVKGMSLRGVARIIGNDYRTVRSWLKVVTEQNEKINAQLIKELGVSKAELDALLSFVKTNSLHQRANS